MNPITERLAGMGQEAMNGALVALDALSRPLTVREIERALIKHGVPRARAVIVAASIKNLSIVALVGGEHG